jgi:hypothetical protein
MFGRTGEKRRQKAELTLSFSHLSGGWVELVVLWPSGKRCGDQLGVR